MAKNYTIKQAKNIIIIVFSKASTFDEATEGIDTLAKNNSYHLRLWDCSNVLFNFTKEEIQEIALYGKSMFLEKIGSPLLRPRIYPMAY